MFIEIKKLTKIYNSYIAVNNINFIIEKNKTVGLLGPNGCGKTTTIGMMLGLISPSDGEILIDDKNINLFKRDEILKRFNFASPYVELPKKLTVKQNLEIYGRLYGINNLDKRIYTVHYLEAISGVDPHIDPWEYEHCGRNYRNILFYDPKSLPDDFTLIINGVNTEITSPMCVNYANDIHTYQFLDRPDNLIRLIHIDYEN